MHHVYIWNMYVVGLLEGKVKEKEVVFRVSQMMGNLQNDEKLTESKQDKCNKVRSLIITPLKTKDKNETIHSAPGLCSAVSWGLRSTGLAKSGTSDILGFCAAAEPCTASHREPGSFLALACVLAASPDPQPLSTLFPKNSLKVTWPWSAQCPRHRGSRARSWL